MTSSGLKFPTSESLAEWLKPLMKPEDFASWGVKPGTNNTHNLWIELAEGESFLDDSTTPPRRTVCVVSVRMLNPTDRTKILMETHQELSDGSVRQWGRPLAEKMKAGEAVKDAALRAVKEKLGFPFSVRIVPGSYRKKTNEMVSSSYPGLPGTFILHIVDAYVDGLPEGDFFTSAQGGEEEVQRHASSQVHDAVTVKKHFWKWDLDSGNVINPEKASVNHETVAFFQHPPQPEGVSNSSSNDSDARKRQLKRERDFRYRQREKESKVKLTREIEQLREENAFLQGALSKWKESADCLVREMGSYEARVRPFVAELQQLKIMLNHQPGAAEDTIQATATATATAANTTSTATSATPTATVAAAAATHPLINNSDVGARHLPMASGVMRNDFRVTHVTQSYTPGNSSTAASLDSFGAQVSLVSDLNDY